MLTVSGEWESSQLSYLQACMLQQAIRYIWSLSYIPSFSPTSGPPPHHKPSLILSLRVIVIPHHYRPLVSIVSYTMWNNLLRSYGIGGVMIWNRRGGSECTEGKFWTWKYWGDNRWTSTLLSVVIMLKHTHVCGYEGVSDAWWHVSM